MEQKLSDILLLTIFSVISGAEGWEDIEDFGDAHIDFLRQYGGFENGIPVHDTVARVMSCINFNKFHECFINWMRDCHSSDDGNIIAIDGKTLRRSYSAELLAGIRHIAVNTLTQHKEFKAGVKRKMRKAAMDRNYFASVFAGCGLL